MIDKITKWIKNYSDLNNIKSLVVGISGGIDSSVVSTLCARTKKPVYVVSMPLNQIKSQHDLSISHGLWLKKNFSNISHHVIKLDDVYKKFYDLLSKDFSSELALANSKSRLRMVVLHQISASTNGIVVGTGNKVEDFGVGFFTKYGDGGVDISPIADLMKSEVWEIGKKLGILQEIIDAPPTDGLWEDGRTDSDQLGGLTYDNMEDAMNNDQSPYFQEYLKIRNKNLHKMKPVPIFKKDE
tara:strand:- start:408 stop:1130 length:723 start_codon:yes stop_codon:yes gene_type:complete